jgi:hypothetical protein
MGRGCRPCMGRGYDGWVVVMFYVYTCILRGCVLDLDMLDEVLYDVLRVYVHSYVQQVGLRLLFSYIYIYMCVCVCVCILYYICIYIFRLRYTFIHTYIHT